MDEQILKRRLKELDDRLRQMQTQLMADRGRNVTRDQLNDLSDKVSNRLFSFAVAGLVVMLVGFSALVG